MCHCAAAEEPGLEFSASVYADSLSHRVKSIAVNKSAVTLFFLSPVGGGETPFPRVRPVKGLLSGVGAAQTRPL